MQAKAVCLAVLTTLTILGANAVQAQTPQTDRAWCGTDVDGAMNCIYRTLADCESVVRGEGGACVLNPDGGVR